MPLTLHLLYSPEAALNWILRSGVQMDRHISMLDAFAWISLILSLILIALNLIAVLTQHTSFISIEHLNRDRSFNIYYMFA